MKTALVLLAVLAMLLGAPPSPVSAAADPFPFTPFIIDARNDLDANIRITGKDCVSATIKHRDHDRAFCPANTIVITVAQTSVPRRDLCTLTYKDGALEHQRDPEHLCRSSSFGDKVSLIIGH